MEGFLSPARGDGGVGGGGGGGGGGGTGQRKLRRGTEIRGGSIKRWLIWKMLEGEMQRMESGRQVSGPEHRHEETVDFQMLSFD